MSPLWMLLVLLVVGGAALLMVATRRVHDDVGPAIDSFHEFRDAIGPRVAALRAETGATRARIDQARVDHKRRR